MGIFKFAWAQAEEYIEFHDVRLCNMKGARAVPRRLLTAAVAQGPPRACPAQGAPK